MTKDKFVDGLGYALSVLLGVALLLLAAYLSVSFVNWDFNVVNWTPGDRAGALVLVVAMLWMADKAG